jgi:hypothetical protein
LARTIILVRTKIIVISRTIIMLTFGLGVLAVKLVRCCEIEIELGIIQTTRPKWC